MQVTYLGHAALMAEAGGVRLVMDPWLEDPAYLDSWWHYPPLALGIRDLMPVDYVWCSHDHPDHFDPKTLRQLPRDQHFLVPGFTSGTLERRYRELGFTNLQVLPFGETVELRGGLRVTCYRTDLVWEDSSIVVEAEGHGLYNQNDCKLGDELLRRIGERHALDLAFLPFSGAIQFPTCYAMPEERKRALCDERRAGHLRAFVHRAGLLRPEHAVPFAGNFCLLAPDQLWMNEVNNINTPDQAAAALEAADNGVGALQMNPGDVWSPEEGLRRHRPAPDFSRRGEQVAEMARANAERIAELRAAEPEARPSLPADFVRYFTERAAQHPELPGRIDANVIFDVTGPNGGLWTLEYSKDGFRVHEGARDEWDMRIEIPAHLLQKVIDDEVVWDEALISFRMRFAENPEFFNEAFWAMLYSPGPRFMQEYVEFDRPLAHAAPGEPADGE